MAKKKENFEESFKELEAIVEKFESGTLNLDESLKEFERGLALAEQLKAHLSAVENRITEIKEKFAD